MSPQSACMNRCKFTLTALVWFFSTMLLQMFPQMTCPRGCIFTLVTFVRLFPTVCFQMCPQMVCFRRGIVILVTFVWLFSTVCSQMCPQGACIYLIRWCKVTLVAFVLLFSTVPFQLSPQITCIRRGIVAFVWFFKFPPLFVFLNRPSTLDPLPLNSLRSRSISKDPSLRSWSITTN